MAKTVTVKAHKRKGKIVKAHTRKVSKEYLKSDYGYGSKSQLGKRSWGLTEEGVPYHVSKVQNLHDVVIMKPAGKYSRLFSQGGFFKTKEDVKKGIKKYVAKNIKKYK